MGSVVKSVVGVVVEVVTKVTKVVGGDILDDMMGLDPIGRELERLGDNIGQVLKVVSGEYHDDVKALQKYQEKVEKRVESYEGGMQQLVDKMEGLIAFHEIFQLAMSNRMDAYYEQYGPEVQAMIEKYKEMAQKLKEEYDFVIGLTQGSFLQRIIGSIIMIIGGIMSDMGDIMSGKADSETWKRMVTVVILVIIVILLWWFPGVIEGATGVAIGMFGAIMITIGAFLTLDSMYANSAAMGGVMSCLDYIFNDMLNLDELIGSDFEKFDKDHEDYAEMVMYTRLAFTIATMIATWGTSTPVAPAQQAGTVVTQSFGGAVETTTTTTATTAADGTMSYATNMSTTIFGINTTTYSTIYSAYTAANSVGDVINANKAHEELKKKLNEDKVTLENAINSKYRKNFVKHYKDTAYFLQDQQMNIDRYVWGMTAQNMYVDPYGTTPVANIRFEPDKDTRMLAFGFEDIFDEDKMAGSKSYFNSILYG